jgi:SAM-dependent methyltransferase
MHAVNHTQETVHCAVCGIPAPTDSPLFRHAARQNSLTYTLHHCPDCDLKFWWPLKAVPDVYIEEGFDAYVDYHTGKRPFPRWSVPLFQEDLADRRTALDIGCGDGAVIARLSGLGLEAHGIDLDAKSIQVARSKFGMQHAKAITLDDYTLECDEVQRRFDLITFFEVLEHQDNPLDFLRKVSRLGHKGTLVAGSVPNRDRFLASLDRKLSEGDLPPHHFLWFSSSALARLFARAGFSDIRVVRTGALPYATLVTKVANAFRRKCSSLPLAGAWKFACNLIAPLAAVVPWAGGRISPSHLYFSAAISTEARSTDRASSP